MFRTDQGLEVWKSGSWKNTEALAPNFTLGAGGKDWAGRSIAALGCHASVFG